ncbi:MAG: DUF4234 domain-containing protein [Dysosmobacter sp.]|nr:DUF4234 domain-containing protein [Dysosmobacter sp.]
MSIQRKSVGLCIVLSIVTCGIYALYWLYRMAEDLNIVTARPNGPSGGLVLLLTIVTCNIYGLYWLYRAGEDLDRQRADQGQLPGHLGILYLLLAIFGFSIISYALLQSELNGYAAE